MRSPVLYGGKLINPLNEPYVLCWSVDSHEETLNTETLHFLRLSLCLVRDSRIVGKRCFSYLQSLAENRYGLHFFHRVVIVLN